MTSRNITLEDKFPKEDRQGVFVSIEESRERRDKAKLGTLTLDEVLEDSKKRLSEIGIDEFEQMCKNAGYEPIRKESNNE